MSKPVVAEKNYFIEVVMISSRHTHKHTHRTTAVFIALKKKKKNQLVY